MGARPTLPTSPSLGNNTRSNPIPFEPTEFYDGLYSGDFHGYLYSIDCWDTNNYPRTRFTTEFGLQVCYWGSIQKGSGQLCC